MEQESKPRCHHIMESGRRCGTPPVKGQHFCYYHDRLHRNYVLPGHRLYEMPNLDNAHGIQIALTHLAAAIAKGLIGPKEAGKMAYVIQLAQNNLKRLAEGPVPPEDAETELTEGMRKVFHLDDHDSNTPSNARATEPDDTSTAPASDYSNHPLAEIEALRPLNQILPAGEAPRWVPITPDESEFLCNNLAADERKATLRQKFCIRRLRLQSALYGVENVTTQEVMKAVVKVEEEEKNAIEIANGLDPAGAVPPAHNRKEYHGARS